MYVVERSCYSVPVALVQLRLLSIRYRLPPPRFRRILLASIASFHVLYSTITDSAINTIELVAVDIASEAVVQSKHALLPLIAALATPPTNPVPFVSSMIFGGKKQSDQSAMPR